MRRPESIEWFIEVRLTRRHLIWLLPHPLPLSLSRQKVSQFISFSLSLVELTDGGGGMSAGGAKWVGMAQ
jgi:hypothetical protein